MMRRIVLPLIGAVVGTMAAWIVVPWTGMLMDAAVPASRWFKVQEIQIGNVKAGSSPLMRVDRIINRNFTGHWTLTLRRETGEGYAAFCTRHGRNDYHVGSVVPRESNLDWWMEVPPNPPCPEIPPGQYMVSMSWTLEIPGFPPKVVRADSNVFEVFQ